VWLASDLPRRRVVIATALPLIIATIWWTHDYPGAVHLQFHQGQQDLVDFPVLGKVLANVCPLHQQWTNQRRSKQVEAIALSLVPLTPSLF
jgi:hypothetical protein